MGRIVDPASVLLELGLHASATEQERALVATSIASAEASIIQYLRYDPVKQSRTEFYPRQDYDYQTAGHVWEATSLVAYQRHVAQAVTQELQMKHMPIRSVASLFIDYDGKSGAKSGSFPSESEKAEGVDFWPNYDGLDSDENKLCHDGILRSVGMWPTSPGTVKVTYTAGYSNEELNGQDTVINAGPIAAAVISEAVRRVNKAFALMKKNTGFTPGAFTSEKLGDYSYSMDSASIQSHLALGNSMAPETQALLEDFVNRGW